MNRASRGRTIGLLGAAVLLLGAALLLAWVVRPDRATGPCQVTSGPAALPEIPETSGLAVSRRHPGLLWSHNDSGNESVLFAIDPAGVVHGRVRLPARTRDWEDISAGPCAAGDCLYIADIGDNSATRRRVSIYRVPEPALDDAETAPPEIIHATYIDGAHNAEALFVVDTALFIVTRDRAGLVYRASIPHSRENHVTFERVGQLGLISVTDAEASRDGTSVVVRTPHEAVWYRSDEVLRDRFTAYLRLSLAGLREPQGEGVALDGNTLFLSSEGRRWNRVGSLLTLRCTLAQS
jgi:hypothetical protein